jgi:hypothetical protein
VSVQPADTEPENQRAVTSDWRREPGFSPPQRVPWSELGPEFQESWGRDEHGRPDPEHIEIIGPTGSGKTWLMCTMLQGRQRTAGTRGVLVCTKPADKTIHRLGWPVVDSWDRLARETHAVFWPQTKRMGIAKREYHAAKINDLLHRLWREDANVDVAFDEVGYVESLSGESKALIQQYWREGRSLGITVAAMKQRPQGALRDMHSETYWTAAFPPKDRSDTERFAELFGAKRDWVPVLDSLSREKREFVIRHARTGDARISWVDTPLNPVKTKKATPPWWRG